MIILINVLFLMIIITYKLFLIFMACGTWFAVLYKQDGKMRVTRETVTASKPKNKTSHKPKKTA